MNTPQISVIIPAYNTQRYIKRCVDSILHQSLKDIEVVIVDDGSTDGTWDVLSELESSDERLCIFHQDNKGVSAARNLGMLHARGEWLMFVDSDDELLPDSIESMYNAVCRTTCDMVVGNYMHVKENGERIHSGKFQYVREWQPDEIIDAFFRFEPDKFQGYIWNRLFRASVFKQYNLYFDENIKYREDGLLLLQYILRSRKNILAIPNVVYIYYDRSNSALGSTKRGFVPALVTNLDARVIILNEMRQYSCNPQNVEMAKQSINKMARILVNNMLHYKYFRIGTWWYIFYTTLCAGALFKKPL